MVPTMTQDNLAEASPLIEDTRTPDFVQSLARGLAVILTFGPDRPELTLAEVAEGTGLTRAAARRFLLTLVKLGYVRSEGRLFSLRPKVLELGYAYLSGLSLAEVAEPRVEELVSSIHESSSICVLDGNDIVYIVRVPTKRIMTISISVGTRFPAYCTSMGRVLLANLPENELEQYLAEVQFEPRTRQTVFHAGELREILHDVHATGYAIVDQELEDGLRSVAVPVHDASGRVIAAMNVSANSHLMSLQELRQEILPQLRQAAGRIEEDLQGKRSVREIKKSELDRLS
jgi:IclR family transcriptional regulator, pca regulon regulatory protein